jgi:hypothetical protein
MKNLDERGCGDRIYTLSRQTKVSPSKFLTRIWKGVNRRGVCVKKAAFRYLLANKHYLFVICTKTAEVGMLHQVLALCASHMISRKHIAVFA